MSRRIEKLQEEIRHRATEILLYEMEDPRLRDVTITRVRLTGDLGFARIYYEAAPAERRSEVEKALQRAAGFVRKGLAGRLQLRLAPQIEFFYDETQEEIRRVEELFAKKGSSF